MERQIRITFLLVLSLTAVFYGCGRKEVHDADPGVYSVAYISDISIEEPERALALIDTAEQRGLLDDYDVNRLRCLVYHNGFSDNIKALQYALKAYESPSARDNTVSFLGLIRMIADQYYLNGNYRQSVKFCTEGIKLAHDSIKGDSEANLTFTLGRNLMVLNRDEEGFRYYRRAVDILDEESKNDVSWGTADDYVYTLAILIGTLRNKGFYDEATALLPRYDEAVRRLSTKENVPPGLIDMRQASGYGMGAVLYAIEGDLEKGRLQYQKLLSTEYSKTPDAGQLIIPYLYQIGDYRAALRHLIEEKKYWQANTDTVSYSYIQNHLESEVDVYEKLGDISSANRVLHIIQALNDTLRERDQNDEALELAEIHKTQEQALQIERQSASILVRNIMLGAGVLLILIGGVFIFRMSRFNRTVSSKNRAMVKTIEDLIVYKECVLELQEENLRLKETLGHKDASPVSEPEVTGSGCLPETSSLSDEGEGASGETVALTDNDRALFTRMNLEILSHQLYLDPGFSRASVMARFRIPAYKFSSIFKEFGGCTFSQYIQNCRLDYAVKMMRENPLWSLKAIAKASQMSNGSFYSQFKKKYGMSPSDFKAGEASAAPDMK